MGGTARRRDELVGTLKAKPGLRRYLRRAPSGLLRIDRVAASREARLDGKWMLRTSDETLTADDLADAYKQLVHIELGWRDMKSAFGVPPARGPHPRSCPAVLAGAAAHPGHRERHRRHIAQPAPLARPDGPGHLGHPPTASSPSSISTPGQRAILTALQLPEPPRFFEFTPMTSDDTT